jgi:hypothetical protein
VVTAEHAIERADVQDFKAWLPSEAKASAAA